MSLNDLHQIFKQDGFICFMDGRKNFGKTDTSLVFAEINYAFGYHTRIATNIRLKEPSYMVEAYINNFHDLEVWLKTKGRKIYILDEFGKHVKRMRFMSSKNVLVMDIVQLIRHYDCGLIGIAPSSRYVDTLFLNTDILDLRVRKHSRTTLEYKDYLHNTEGLIYDFPKTSIKFVSKHDAIFTLEAQIDTNTLPLYLQIARMYGETGSYKTCEQHFNIKPEQVRKAIHKALTKNLILKTHVQPSGIRAT